MRCLSVLDSGHFILFVCFFPWPRSSKVLRMGRQFFKNVCLSWIWSFYFICLYFSLAAKLKRSANGASIL